MAVTKLWKVSVRLGQVLDYTTNPEKTANPEYSAEDYQALKDVLAYAKDEEKTEHEFFCDGINCNVAMARDQFITVKEQFGKTDGIQAYHGYLSFKENEVTPEQAQQIGMEFARKMWGKRFQVVVTTHLNTKHLHCHFVINSVSFADGKRLKDKEMLSLPISTTKLCLAKFTVLILLAAFQMVMSIGAYYICAAIVTHTQDYNFILEPLYVCKNVYSIYAAAIPMAAVYLAVSTLIQSPIFSVGIGLASIVPSVLMINTKIWFAYPMSYPFYLIMVAYGRAAEGVYETQIAWLPWLPVAVGITILALVVSCMRYGASERR